MMRNRSVNLIYIINIKFTFLTIMDQELILKLRAEVESLKKQLSECELANHFQLQAQKEKLEYQHDCQLSLLKEANQQFNAILEQEIAQLKYILQVKNEEIGHLSSQCRNYRLICSKEQEAHSVEINKWKNQILVDTRAQYEKQIEEVKAHYESRMQEMIKEHRHQYRSFEEQTAQEQKTHQEQAERLSQEVDLLRMKLQESERIIEMRNAQNLSLRGQLDQLRNSVGTLKSEYEQRLERVNGQWKDRVEAAKQEKLQQMQALLSENQKLININSRLESEIVKQNTYIDRLQETFYQEQLNSQEQMDQFRVRMKQQNQFEIQHLKHSYDTQIHLMSTQMNDNSRFNSLSIADY